jgi:hypothetical protein
VLRRCLQGYGLLAPIERLYRSPSPENAQSAKRAFRMLALRFHPDQGGRREDFIRLK